MKGNPTSDSCHQSKCHWETPILLLGWQLQDLDFLPFLVPLKTVTRTECKSTSFKQEHEPKKKKKTVFPAFPHSQNYNKSAIWSSSLTYYCWHCLLPLSLLPCTLNSDVNIIYTWCLTPTFGSGFWMLRHLELHVKQRKYYVYYTRDPCSWWHSE